MKGESLRRRLVLCLALLFATALTLQALSPTAIAEQNPSGWFSQDSGTAYQFDGMSAGDRNTAWAVTAGSCLLFKTADGGAHWALQDLGAGNHALDVGAVDGSVAWVVGVHIDGTNADVAVFKTTDSGATWSMNLVCPLPSGYGLDFPDMEALDSDSAWMSITASRMFWPPDYASAVFKTTDGGDNWIPQVGGSDRIYSLSAVRTDTAWALFDGYILRTTDGVTWTRSDVPATVDTGSLSAVDADTAWIAAGSIFKTDDGGQTWTAQESGSSRSLGSIVAVDERTAWACGGQTGQVMLKTSDGNTWSAQDVPVGDELYAVCALDCNIAWAAGAGGVIIHTTDGGSGQPKPCIHSVAPPAGPPGTEVTVTGSGFRDEKGPLSYVKFGSEAAVEYALWSDTEIMCRVPSPVAPGEVPLTVTTIFWISGATPFTVEPPTVTVLSIAPDFCVEGTTVEVTDLAGTGFQQGATVRLENGATVIEATDVSVISDSRITCRLDLAGAPLGRYTVVVANPDGSEGRLAYGFSVTNVCGVGAGAFIAGFGMVMVLLSGAGAVGLFGRRN